MAITYYMLQIPHWLFFLLIVFFGGLFAGLCTLFFRKYINVKILKSHNEVTGFLFLAISSFYGLLLSFIVLAVWGQLNETKSNVSKEGSSAIGLYYDIKFYPDTIESKQLMILYLDFVYHVVDEEFPNMEQLKPSINTIDAFSQVFNKMEHLNPKNQFQIQLVAEMYNHLNQLGMYRGLRVSSMETEIPPSLWMPLILGALIIILCIVLMDIAHLRMHIALNVFMGMFIAMILFIIILLDHPFAGESGIIPKSYREIFTMEKINNEFHSSISKLNN